MDLLIDLDRSAFPLNGIGQISLGYGRWLGANRDRLATQLCPWARVPRHMVGRFGPALSYYPRRRLDELLPAAQRRFDLWHSPYQFPYCRPASRRTRWIYTIHDLNFLDELDDRRMIERMLRLIQKDVDRASAVTTISDYVAGHVRERLRIGDKPMVVIPNAPTLDLTGISERPAGAPNAWPFLFSIGDVTPKKNLHTLVSMLAHLPELHLVIAGPDGHPYTHRIRADAARHGLTDRVHLLGPVSEAEKRWLHLNCAAFAFPSLLEGFGIPPLESMLASRPTFISNRCSLPEVTGGLAYQWPGFDPEDMAEVYRRCMAHWMENPAHRQACTAHASGFTWECTGSGYLDLYRRVANELATVS